MTEPVDLNNREILEVLREIRELLIPISACFEDEYLEVQKQKLGEKLAAFEKLLTSTRRQIFPLLFDPRGLSQVDIAKEVNTSQPTVSRFVNTLLEQDMIDQDKNSDGNIVYKDKYNLLKLIQN